MCVLPGRADRLDKPRPRASNRNAASGKQQRKEPQDSATGIRQPQGHRRQQSFVSLAVAPGIRRNAAPISQRRFTKQSRQPQRQAPTTQNPANQPTPTKSLHMRPVFRVLFNKVDPAFAVRCFIGLPLTAYDWLLPWPLSCQHQILRCLLQTFKFLSDWVGLLACQSVGPSVGWLACRLVGRLAAWLVFAG